MAAPPQTFRPAPKKLVGPALTSLAFFAATVAAVLFVPRETSQRASVLGLAFVIGLPFLMGLLSAIYALGLMARTTVDAEGLTIAGPLGTRTARWGDVVGWDVVGTAKQGVTLELRNGRRLGIPYVAYEGEDLRRTVDARLRRLPKADVEGREFRVGSRWGLSGLIVGVLLFLILAASTLPSPLRTQLWLLAGAMAVLTLPIVALALSDRVVLRDGVLTRRTLFGARRLVLREVRKAELRVVSTKGGSREVLVLTGPTTFRLSAQRDGYAMLRDAILRELPSGIRPRPLA